MIAMKTPSKIDVWIGLLIWFGILATVVSIIFMPANQLVVGLLIGIPLIVFLLWIYFGTWYELRDELLFCRCGPFFQRIPYINIRSLKLVKNPLSSMALSLERIEIREHGKGYILGTTFISPVNRETFLEELAVRCPNLEV